MNTRTLCSLFLLLLLQIGSRPGFGQPPSQCRAVADKTAREIPSLGSFLVWKDGRMVVEGYYHGADSNTVFSIKSATKSFLSAIAGAARLRNLLPDLSTPVLKILPEYDFDRSHKGVWFADDLREDDSIRRLLTLSDLLTMRTGLDWNDFGESGQSMCNVKDPVQFTLDLAFDTVPGVEFNYVSGAALVFGVALARCVKSDLLTFADSTLFRPAGIHIDHWDTDPLGRYTGTSEMFLTAANMMRFGLLYLDRGRAGDRELLSEEWIQESTAPHARLEKWDVLPGANGYGYYWWRRKSNGHQVFVASGYGGQLICVIPDLSTVITTTCTLGDDNRGRSEIRRLHLAIDRIIRILGRLQ